VSVAALEAPGPRVTGARIALWGGAVVMLLIYSQGWTNLISGGGTNPDESALMRNMFFPAYGLAVIGLAMQPWDAFKAVLRQPFMILLLGIAALSITWSIAPDVSARRVFGLACTTLGGIMLATRFRWRELAEVLAIAVLVLVVVSAFVSAFIPSLGRMTELFPGAWRGLWPEKNALGGNMALGFAMAGSAALLNPKRAWLWCGVAAGALFLVLMSTSKTSLVSLMLGACGLGFTWIVRRGPAWAVSASWIALVAIGGLAAFLILDTAAFFEILGKDSTLTGRTQIWSAVMRQIAERPWRGYGYFAVWDDTSGWGPIAWITHDAHFTPHHAHNSWLEQWLGMGIAGLALWGLFYLQTLTAALVAIYRHPGGQLALPFLLVYSLTSLTESIAVVYNDMRWVIFVALAVKLAWPDPPEPQAARRAPSATVTIRQPALAAASASRSRL
jgi:exopolysaccharide production protein ExoQ